MEMVNFVGVKPGDTSATTLVPAQPSGINLVGWIQVAEISGSGTTVTIDVYDGSSIAYQLGSVMPLAAREVIKESWIEEGGLPLPPGFSVRVTAGNADRLTATAAFAPRSS